eukprot:SAG11_NODE_1932_length_4043_cov_4.892748_2_plen_154_part_00
MPRTLAASATGVGGLAVLLDEPMLALTAHDTGAHVHADGARATDLPPAAGAGPTFSIAMTGPLDAQESDDDDDDDDDGSCHFCCCCCFSRCRSYDIIVLVRHWKEPVVLLNFGSSLRSLLHWIGILCALFSLETVHHCVVSNLVAILFIRRRV